MKHKLLNKLLALTILILGGAFLNPVWGDDITFDFEDNTAHRTSGNNSYDSNSYSENGVNISLTYADAVTTGTPLNGSANVIGRIAKKTTNSPIVKIGPINITNKQVTGIAYTIKGVAAMAMAVEYSLDNSTWNNLQSLSSLPTSSTDKSVTDLNITGTNFYLRFTVSVSSSTSSSRDFQLDDIVITYTTTTPTHTLTYSATNGSISGVVYNTSTAVASGASVAEGGKVTLTATPASGYSFTSWEVSGTGSSLSSSTTNPTTFTMGTANATVTANFTATGGTTTYSVTYNANGATSGSVPADNNEYEENDEVTVLGNTGNLAKTGNAFSGWNTQSDGLGTNYGEDDTFEITANTTLYAKWTPYTITAQSNNNTYGTVELSGSVITGSPASGYRYATPAYTVSSGSATVEQDGNEFTVTPTSNCTVTINFEAIPCYTVTLSDDTDNPITEESAGSGVTLPSRSAIGSYAFAGWSVTNVSEETTTAPTIIQAGTYNPTANITLYPIYTKSVGGGSTVNNVSTTIKNYAEDTSHNWSDGTQYTTLLLDGNVTCTASSSGNNGKYYSSGYDWRFYQSDSGTLTIGTSSGTLNSVTFTFSSADDGTFVYNSSAITSETAVNVSGNTSAQFSVGSTSGTKGKIKITEIAVSYTTSSSITYYWSAPVVATVETPQITVAENFYISTTASISCATEGATIYYSYDNSEWNEYTDELTITATTTIYAKAQKGDDWSNVASVTTTKQLATPTVTINVPDGFTNDLADETEVAAGTLTASVTYNEAAVASASVTWESTNTEVATVNATTGAVTLIAKGTAKIRASYAGNSDYAAASAEYDLTVIDSYEKGQRNNPYTVSEVNTGNYSGNNYVIGYIVGFFNAYDKDATTTATSSTVSNVALSDSPNEIGGANTIAIQLPSGALRNAWNIYNNAVIGYKVLVYGSIESYFSNKTGVKSTSEITAVAVPAAVSTSSYATFAANAALDFTDSNIKAYIAEPKDDGSGVTFERVYKIPANTGVLLYKDGGATEEIPVTTESTDDVANNVFVRGTGATVASEDGDLRNYILNKVGGVVGFYKAAGQKVAANRAYIQIDESASLAKDFISMPGFDDDPTGVNEVNGSGLTVNGPVYDLQGRRIEKPGKGLYIVNGKKILKY